MAVTDGNWEFDKFDDGSTSKKDKSESSQNKFYKCALTLHIEIFASKYYLSVTLTSISIAWCSAYPPTLIVWFDIFTLHQTILTPSPRKEKKMTCGVTYLT